MRKPPRKYFRIISAFDTLPDLSGLELKAVQMVFGGDGAVLERAALCQGGPKLGGKEIKVAVILLSYHKDYATINYYASKSPPKSS